jgi:heme oxygenase
MSPADHSASNPAGQGSLAERASIMPRLRAHTSALHAATEELPLMRALMEATEDGYRRYLVRIHAVYTAVEPPLYAPVSGELRRALGVTPKLEALEKDLTGLGLQPPSDPSQPDQASASARQRIDELLGVAPPGRVGAALGGLYVLEGATLGGQVIARRLQARWNGSPPPLEFLQFRGKSAPVDWRGFGAALTAWADRHPEAEGAILDGAGAVFEVVHEALRDG